MVKTITALLLCMSVGMICCAQQKESDFKIAANGTITSYTGQNTKVFIPDKIHGVSVTAIGNRVFWYKKLKSVVIPDGVISIDYWAFNGNRLKDVIIPNSVTSIGNYAFANNRLKSITIGDNVILGIMGFVDRTEQEPIYMSSFEDGFDDFYSNNGKKAGTYILNKGQWSIR